MATKDCFFKLLHLLICFILCFSIVESVAEEPYFVKFREAVVHGFAITSDAGISYPAFIGLPYAKPPIGSLRFKAPQPYGNIKGSFNANKNSPVCMQLDPSSGKYVGDENCLTLNVYLPENPQERLETKHPVVVFIHGGSFQSGSGSIDTYKPFKLLQRGLIVVTLNYRLGPLGFLSTSDDISPGNYGLLDQVEALRWLQHHLPAFGGDVNQITLFGHDAGAASALYHLLSPLSKGLFHQIIALSGSPVCDVFLQKDPKKWATELGSKLDCPIQRSDSLIDCLRQKLPEEIIEKSVELQKSSKRPPIFLPVVERVHKDNGDFLPDTPVNLLKDGKVNRAPVILGLNRQEGLRYYNDYFGDLSVQNDDFFDHTVPDVLKLTSSFRHHLKEISLAVKHEYYTGNSLENEDMFANATQEMFIDLLLRRCYDQTARLLSEPGWPTYMYVSENSTTFRNQDTGKLPSLRHYEDDLNFLFLQRELSESEAKLERILLSIWINFAKTSMPTPSKYNEIPFLWMPMNPGKIRYLKVDENPQLVEGYLTQRMQFWNVKMVKVERGEIKKDEL